MPGTGELLVILLIVLVIFGGARIPELMRSLGKGMREFKKAASEDADKPSDVVRRKDNSVS